MIAMFALVIICLLGMIGAFVLGDHPQPVPAKVYRPRR